MHSDPAPSSPGSRRLRDGLASRRAVAEGSAARSDGDGPSSPGSDPGPVADAVAAFQAGRDREESFRFLFETYHLRVRRFFARRTASAEECLDLCQETFLRVYKGLDGYRGDAPFGAWVFRIAWNVHVQLVVRRRQAEPASEADSVEEMGDRAGIHDHGGASRLAVGAEGYDKVLDGQQRRLLREAIGRLPEQRRKCIVLWAYHGLTYEQIAGVMRLALGTVKAHLAQAREQLDRLAAEET